MNRTHETTRLNVGQKITYSGFPGTVTRLYIDGEVEGARMYDIRLASGSACVTGADLVPVRDEPTKYRGFSIEQERDGSYSLFRFGYVAGGFRTVEAAKADVDKRVD